MLGSPIRHSLSPVLHEAAYQALDLRDWHYGKIECDEAGLPQLVDSMGAEWAGLPLTMPLKRVALTVAGMVSAPREAGLDRVEQALILGAGGTAQAAPSKRGSLLQASGAAGCPDRATVSDGRRHRFPLTGSSRPAELPDPVQNRPVRVTINEPGRYRLTTTRMPW